MSKVVGLDGKEYTAKEGITPNKAVIAMVESVLEGARKGYIQEVVVVAGLADGNVVSDYEGLCDSPALMQCELQNMNYLYYNIHHNPLIIFDEE